MNLVLDVTKNSVLVHGKTIGEGPAMGNLVMINIPQREYHAESVVVEAFKYSKSGSVSFRVYIDHWGRLTVEVVGSTGEVDLLYPGGQVLLREEKGDE